MQSLNSEVDDILANPCLIWTNALTCYGVAWLTFCRLLCNRSLFFGDVSSQKDPSTYLKYICSIYDYYQKEYCTFDKRQNSSKIHLPLVVNTSGWVKGKLVHFVFLLHINYCFSRPITIYQLLCYSFSVFCLAFQVMVIRY